MEIWYQGSELKKRISPFRFFYEQLLFFQQFTRFPPKLLKDYLAFIKREREALRQLQRDGADVGYVLSILLDVAWTIRIPPLGAERKFWERRSKVIKKALKIMSTMPFYFSNETIIGIEKGLKRFPWLNPDRTYFYLGVNEIFYLGEN